MTKQEFAIRLLFWLMPWPLSKALPRILRRILLGPAAQTPLQWAQATYDALTQFLSDATAYAETVFDIIPDIPPTDQLTEAEAALTTAIENGALATDPLTPIMADLDAYTPDQISDAFSDAINTMDDLVSAMDDLLELIEDVPPVKPPPYISPIPPLYPGLSGLGQWGQTYTSQPAKPVTPPWFYDDFDIIDPAIWTDESSGDAAMSIVDAKLKIRSSEEYADAYISSAADATIPSAFTCTFELKITSAGAMGDISIGIFTGVHYINIFFDADTPTIVGIRPVGCGVTTKYTVNNYLNLTHTWKIVYNGTTVDFYRDQTLIFSDYAPCAITSLKGKSTLKGSNIVTAYLDDWTITPL